MDDEKDEGEGVDPSKIWNTAWFQPKGQALQT